MGVFIGRTGKGSASIERPKFGLDWKFTAHTAPFLDPNVDLSLRWGIFVIRIHLGRKTYFVGFEL